MTRQPHDQFAKQYLKELLEPLGEVKISEEIPGETLQIDLIFVPSPEPPSNPPALGLLSQLASTPCLLEPYRNSPTHAEIRSCILKLFHVHGELQRQAKREQPTLDEAQLPRLWILTPTISERVREYFGAHLKLEQWCTGVYLLADGIKTGIIAINQLPEIPETLWLRMLGKGGTQKRAIEEVLALPQDHPQRRNILELVGIWRINVESKIDLDPEERELIMELSPAYIKWREDTLQQGQRLMIEALLRTRLGELDEALLAIISPLLELPPDECMSLGLHASREELLAQFGSNSRED
ncbi:hypothetical protein [Roseofilum capinflatum]|uniref:Flagellar assembly protein H n=1 Tax=Roseofilum capinflatum BLCC-M114 TaxID=3022440 RepID=A0ABT7B6Q3_9CYAN|nr:hypothetical protein [Roseofilum capinflatum]MDJ1174840.1 hypothetical protein [Roseofilum capinflatum BLCC-M114]